MSQLKPYHDFTGNSKRMSCQLVFFVAFLFPQHHDAARRQSYAKIVQGERNFRASECRAELVRAMPSAAENVKK